MGSWADEITVQRAFPSVLVDRIKDQVGGDLGMSLSDAEPKAKKGE